MKGISRESVNNKEIIVIDYSDCNEDRMIELLVQVRKLIRAENKRQRVLAIFNQKSFLTPKVMEYFNSDRLGSYLLERQAAIGVSLPKKGIIQGHNILEKNDIMIFDSKKDALDFLAGD